MKHNELKPENRTLFRKIERSERYLNWVLVTAALMFLGHIVYLIISNGAV